MDTNVKDKEESVVDVPVKDTRIGGKDGIRPGRQKGAKNKSTLLREALTNNFEEQLSKKFHKVIEVVLEQAVDGCRQSQKLLIDRIVPTVHAESDKEKNPFAGGINITISAMESNVSVSPEDISDAEYSVIEEDNNEST